jgi:hypothetical protein
MSNTDQSGRENTPIGGEPDCSRHKKEIAGISDMKVLAEMIGDLHYEALGELLVHLSHKIWGDSVKDREAGRIQLANALLHTSVRVDLAYECMKEVWRISKKFMNDKNQPK